MGSLYSIISVLLFFCLGVNLAGQAQKIYFNAAYLEYNQGLNMIILKDEAAISSTDFRIQANNLQYNIDSGDIVAQGNIRLWRADEIVEGENIIYNVHTAEGRVNNFRSISQNTFIRGQEADIYPRKNTLKNGSFTTCEHEHPHYRISAKEMVLLPDQALLLKNAAFYLGNRKLFSMPAYRFDLRQGYVKAPLLLLPGYDRSRGFYVKGSWSFLLDEKNHGELKLLPTARQGLDFSLSLFLNDDTNKPTNINFSKQENRSVGGLTHRLQLSQAWETERHGDFQVNTSYLWDRQRFLGLNKEFDYSAIWTDTIKNGHLQLEFTGREDPDHDTYIADNNMRYLEKLPAFTIESNTRQSEQWPLQYRYGGKWSYFKENQPGSLIKEQDRELYANIFADTIQHKNSITGMNLQLRANQYSSGDNRQYYRFNLNSSQNMGAHFSLQSNYHKHEVFGDNPFLAWDKQRSSESVTERLNYSGRNLSATVFQFNYNIQNSWFSNPSSYFHYHSVYNTMPWSLGLQLAYRQQKNNSLQDMKADNAFASLHLQKSLAESFTLRGQYSNTNSRWESFGSEAKFFGNQQHYLEIGSHYNAISHEFTKISLGVIKDFDCMEGRIDWDFRQKEFTIQVYLKQGSSVGLGLRVDYDNQFSVKPDLPGIDGS